MLALVVLLTPSVASAENVIADIERTKILKVCQAADSPWSSINPLNGEWEGFTVDLVNRLASELEVSVENIDAGWSGLVQNLATGGCHMAAAAMFATVPRSKVVLFTNPFAYEGQAAVVKKGSGLNSYVDIDQPDKVVIGFAGSATTAFAEKFFKNATVRPVNYPETLQVVADVAAGRADAAWVSYVSHSLLLKANPNLDVEFVNEKPIGFSAIRWAIPPGEYQFQQLINNWLTQAIASGEVAEDWGKWFQDVPYVDGRSN